MKRFILTTLFALSLAWIAMACAGDVPLNRNRNVTLISTSDPHFRTVENPSNNQWDHETIEQMNKVTEMTWPTTPEG